MLTVGDKIPSLTLPVQQGTSALPAFSEVKVASGTKLTVHSPSHARGQVNLTVTTAGGTSKNNDQSTFRFD